MEFDLFAERERDGWADPEIAEGYVQGFGPVVDAAVEAHLTCLPAHGKILDLCCGQGTLTARISKDGREVHGLDFSPEMIARARVAAPKALIDEGDAQDLPYDDNSFDAVVNNFGMMHIPDQPKALREVARVLKPGGIFSMTSWVGPEASDAFRLIFTAARANMPEGVTPPPQPDLFIYGRKDDVSDMFTKNGLQMDQHRLLPLAWQIDTPDALFHIFLSGTVGARMTLMTLDPAGRDAAATSVSQTIRRDYRDKDGYRVPAPVAHIVARPA